MSVLLYFCKLRVTLSFVTMIYMLDLWKVNEVTQESAHSCIMRLDSIGSKILEMVHQNTENKSFLERHSRHFTPFMITPSLRQCTSRRSKRKTRVSSWCKRVRWIPIHTGVIIRTGYVRLILLHTGKFLTGDLVGTFFGSSREREVCYWPTYLIKITPSWISCLLSVLPFLDLWTHDVYQETHSLFI